MTRDLARRILRFIGGIFLICLLGQVFLAGLGVSDDPSAFLTHRDVGDALGFGTLVIVVSRSSPDPDGWCWP